MHILKLENIVKNYQNHIAVDDVSFEVPKGIIFGMLGPNGAGKTSIIRIITSITKADKGVVYFDNQPLNLSHREQIGYMPEERGLYKKMKVGEQLEYLAQLKGLSKKEALKRINYWFEKFEIDNWKNKKVEELSKGMQQKIQFIATVIHEPKLLILDEPFSGLDPVNSNLIKDEIMNLKNNGTTIIFSTHRMEQVEQICEEIVLINKGKNVLNGRVSEIRQRFKENLYEFELEGDLPEALNHYAEIISVESSVYKLKINENIKTKELLTFLLENEIAVKGFRELLPGINEIFIKTVENK
jgi:ABC-2 type transport system ATP-binding protein